MNVLLLVGTRKGAFIYRTDRARERFAVDGPKTHSINVDPRDSDHMYVGLSGGGVFESKDGGASWRPLNKGIEADFLPDPDAETGHDPHCLVQHPARPDRLYQQNHCGIYRLDRPG